MKPDWNRLLRPNVRSLKPYSSARDEFTGSALVFLDANESPFPTATNRYPDPYQGELRRRIAGLRGIGPEHLFLGNGSDEAIDLLLRALCEPGRDNLITMPPTYGMYAVTAGINDVAVREVGLDAEFQPNAEKTLASVDERTKLIFFCSPNNPTGNLMPEAVVLEVAERFAGVVVVDEAYVDFASRSLLAQVSQVENLVVLQTLSKAWGMAAIRLGMLFGSTDLVAALNKIKPPYNVSGLTQSVALEAMGDEARKDAGVATILAERATMERALGEVPAVLRVFPSDANFLLIRVENAHAMYRFLLDRGIVVRNRSSLPGCAGCLRFTVGTSAENRLLLEALRAYRP